jgi:hypothetical protein
VRPDEWAPSIFSRRSTLPVRFACIPVKLGDSRQG